jgi:hypothetical protein
MAARIGSHDLNVTTILPITIGYEPGVLTPARLLSIRTLSFLNLR